MRKKERKEAEAALKAEAEKSSAPETPVAPTVRGKTPNRRGGSRGRKTAAPENKSLSNESSETKDVEQ